MTEQPEITETAVSPTRWVWQLTAATVAITVATFGLFYYTARGILNKPADAVAIVPGVAVDPSANVVSLDHGLAVYARHCANCHGPAGLGDGPAAAQLNPKARDFSTGWFKLGSTRSGLPSVDDLCTTIRHGMLP